MSLLPFASGNQKTLHERTEWLDASQTALTPHFSRFNDVRDTILDYCDLFRLTIVENTPYTLDRPLLRHAITTLKKPNSVFLVARIVCTVMYGAIGNKDTS